MNLWWILYILDGVLFAFVALTVLYFLIFSIASLFKHKNEIKKGKKQNRIIVLIPSHKQDKVIRQTVNSILGQTYPQRMFDVVVISDHQEEIINMQLAQLPITLLTPNFDKSSKAKSLQYAIFNLPKFKIYDAVLILDAGNIVKPDFLEKVNDAFDSSGAKAIQIHRLSENRDTPAARLDSIFEEINNSVFRRGHQVLGLSASLNGSGIVFDFEWFKANIMKVRDAVGEDKALESLLLRDRIFVDYFEDIYIYDEKTRDINEFNKQRSRWIYTQLHAAANNLRFLPRAILNRNYDHIDKILQWLLIPRTILMGIIIIMSIILPFIYMTLAIKWWIAAAVILFAFALATPDYLVDDHWDRDFLRAPLISSLGLVNIFRAGHSEATDRVSSASKWVKEIKNKKRR
ncbi:MAG: glycosyltransferase family 2 protein [Prevotella sp.]|nr:glycosyltransferase family 2 protein [Prevotella sp.]